MANQSNVPVIIIHEKDKKVSRLLLGSPAVMEVIAYETEDRVLAILHSRFSVLFSPEYV